MRNRIEIARSLLGHFNLLCGLALTFIRLELLVSWRPANVKAVVDALNEAHLGSMSDAELLVVSIAGQREISPSDTEIQARLEVGRPRLSQIYNALQRSGILSVRKEGRSRLFKLSDAAAEMLP